MSISPLIHHYAEICQDSISRLGDRKLAVEKEQVGSFDSLRYFPDDSYRCQSRSFSFPITEQLPSYLYEQGCSFFVTRSLPLSVTAYVRRTLAFVLFLYST